MSKPTPGQVDSIYQAYPRHVGREAAIKAIGKALKKIAADEAVTDPVAFLIDRVKAYAKSPAGQRGTYTPHPSTWFNQGRYDDDASEWQLVDEREVPKEQAALAAWRKGTQ